ncbi:ATP-binding protein [Ochrobactrum pseudogrignonense]|nr:ATP-binding protein [Brucella pseudogrignonensis]
MDEKKLLTAILSELGHPDARGTLSDLEDDIIGILARDPKRPLIIDESDKLVDRNMIELVRMIAKKSNVPVLLIGEELFPKKLERVDRFRDLVLEWGYAQPCDWTTRARLPERSAVTSMSGMIFSIRRALKVTAASAASVTPSIPSPTPPTNSA